MFVFIAAGSTIRRRERERANKTTRILSVFDSFLITYEKEKRRKHEKNKVKIKCTFCNLITIVIMMQSKRESQQPLITSCTCLSTTSDDHRRHNFDLFHHPTLVLFSSANRKLRHPSLTTLTLKKCVISALNRVCPCSFIGTLQFLSG